jgi:hypothetical protein
MARDEVHGECFYCLQQRKLALSHAIPNAFFRDIFRENDGNAVLIPGDTGRIHLSNNSGKAPLLCVDCEGLFNRHLDGPSINFLKSHRAQLNTLGATKQATFESALLARFILSVFWRGAALKSELYKHSNCKVLSKELVKSYLLDATKNPFNVASFLVRNIIDDDLNVDFGSDYIVLPRSELVQINDRQEPYLRAEFVAKGFSFETYFPKLPARTRRIPGMLRSGTQILTPDIGFLKCHAMHGACMNMMHKHVTGMSTLAD